MRQGKLSELIHNSGSIEVTSEESEVPPPTGNEIVEGAEFDDEDSDEEEFDSNK